MQLDSKDGENRTRIGVDKGEGMRTIKDQGKSFFFSFLAYQLDE